MKLEKYIRHFEKLRNGHQLGQLRGTPEINKCLWQARNILPHMYIHTELLRQY